MHEFRRRFIELCDIGRGEQSQLGGVCLVCQSYPQIRVGQDFMSCPALFYAGYVGRQNAIG